VTRPSYHKLKSKPLSPTMRALVQELREVNRQIAALTPNGAVCKRCLAVNVHWLFNVYVKGDAILVNDDGGRHFCEATADAFDVVPE
jgi:hypothetical protein